MAQPQCRVVYQQVCHTGGYSPGSYSNIGPGYGHRLYRREAQAEGGKTDDVRLFMFLISDGEREGKSYGEQHLGNNGIVPAAVGVVPGPRGYGVVHGNVDTYFLYKDKVHTGVPCSFLNAKMDF